MELEEDPLEVWIQKFGEWQTHSKDWLAGHQQPIGWTLLGLGFAGFLFLTLFIQSLSFIPFVLILVLVLFSLIVGFAAALWGGPKRVTLTLLTLALVLSPPVLLTGPYHLTAYENGGDDLLQFRNLLNDQDGWQFRSELISPALVADEHDPSILVIMGVERPFHEWEIEILVEYVRDGGVMFLADDFGHAGPLARSLSNASAADVSVQFVSSPLYPGLRARHLFSDPALHNSTALVPIEAQFGSQKYIVATNIPAGLNAVGPVTYLANSTNDSIIDRNDSGTIDILDETGPIEVVVEMEVEDGRVVFCSDPSIFINEMLYLEDNAAFTVALFEYLGAAERSLIIDESRHPLLNVEDGAIKGVISNPGAALATPGTGLLRGMVALTRSATFAPLLVGICLLVAAWLLGGAPAKGDMMHRHDLSGRQGGPVQISPATIQNRVKKMVLKAMEEDLGIDKGYRRNHTDREVRKKIGHRVLSMIYYDHHIPLREEDCFRALQWLEDFRQDEEDENDEDDGLLEEVIIE